MSRVGTGSQRGAGSRAEAAAAAPASDAADPPGRQVSKRPCPRDLGDRSAAPASGAETERGDTGAGLVTRLWVPVNPAGRSPALPPPPHPSWRAGSGAGSWPLPSAPATPARPPAPARRALGLRVLPAQPPPDKCAHTRRRGKPQQPGMEPGGRHPSVGVPIRSL